MTHTYFGLFDAFEQMVDQVIRFGTGSISSIYRENFPPLDVIVDTKTKNLTFRFALAGLNPDLVEISFDEDSIGISYQGEQVSLKETEEYLKKGLKTGKFSSSYYVPFSKYDVDNTKAEFKDGLLTVLIPAKEVTNKTVTIEKI